MFTPTRLERCRRPTERAGQKRKPRQSGTTLNKFGKSAKTSNSYLCEKCPQLEFDGGQTDEGDPWFVGRAWRGRWMSSGGPQIVKRLDAAGFEVRVD